MQRLGSRIKHSITTWVHGHHLVTGLLLVALITLLLTTVSMMLYITSGTSGLDLSRPGIDNKAREEVSKEKSPTFSPTGTLTKKDMETFTKMYNEQREKLKRIGNFDDQALSDESLGIVAGPNQNE